MGAKSTRIHASLARCDTSRSFSVSYVPKLKSTHPLRDATIWFCIYNCRKIAKIHASLAGCDLSRVHQRSNLLLKSTHPLRDATLFRIIQNIIDIAKIHASLAECDKIFPIRPVNNGLLKSTHPLRDATISPAAI